MATPSPEESSSASTMDVDATMIVDEDILTSDLFTFYVGPEKKAFRVQSKLFTTKSAVFDRMINGSMQEAHSSSMELTDLDASDFVKVCGFFYSGKLFYPKASRDNPKKTSLSLIDTENITDACLNGCQRCKNYEGSCAHCYPKSSDGPIFSRISCSVFKRRGSEDCSGTDIFSTLQLYTRLYVFAEKYDIPTLKSEIVKNFGAALSWLKCVDKETVESLLDLIRFIYSDECTPDLGPGLEPLRRLCVDYLLLKVVDLGAETQFVDFMAEGGAFTRDFWLSTAHLMLPKGVFRLAM